MTAQVEGNKVVYSIVLTNAKNPLSREEVESYFEGELSKKYTPAEGTTKVGDSTCPTATFDNRRAHA